MAEDGEAMWEYGLFGCFDNPGLCCQALFCPCYLAGKKAEVLGENCLLCGLVHLLCTGGIGFAASVALRGRLRERRGIKSTLTADIIWLMCCPICAQVQEAAEIKVMQDEDASPAENKIARY